jgi:predicted CoA-substrate-specific enzyme activase
MEGFLGLDVGSVSTNLAFLDVEAKVVATVYRRTRGEPIKAVQEGLLELKQKLPPKIKVLGVGTTGSGRQLSSVVVGADIVKNEITAHAVAASHVVPGVRTVLEIGGQDSKIIFLKDDIVVDFAMNTVCAAGTGSFLDHQASRLGIPIEEFGNYALKSKSGALIAGRCSVFAESDMIHKQQVGYCLEDIIYGLCQALVRNYLSNLAKGKEILPPVVFQGGVAANVGMRRAFQEALNLEITVPEHFNVMGAVGAALLAKEEKMLRPLPTKFKGFEAAAVNYRTKSFFCRGCENNCEIVRVIVDNHTLACWGGRCGKWETAGTSELEATVTSQAPASH